MMAYFLPTIAFVSGDKVILWDVRPGVDTIVFLEDGRSPSIFVKQSVQPIGYYEGQYNVNVGDIHRVKTLGRVNFEQTGARLLVSLLVAFKPIYRSGKRFFMFPSKIPIYREDGTFKFSLTGTRRGATAPQKAKAATLLNSPVFNVYDVQYQGDVLILNWEK